MRCVHESFTFNKRRKQMNTDKTRKEIRQEQRRILQEKKFKEHFNIIGKGEYFSDEDTQSVGWVEQFHSPHQL